MEMVPDDKAKGMKTPIWEEYKKIVNDAEKKEVGLALASYPGYEASLTTTVCQLVCMHTQKYYMIS